LAVIVDETGLVALDKMAMLFSSLRHDIQIRKAAFSDKEKVSIYFKLVKNKDIDRLLTFLLMML
jgi:hypothetical protein